MGLFTDHPRSVGESYTQHFGVASGVGTKMILAGVACWVHAVFPFLCKSTGSKTIVGLHKRMVHGREKFGHGDVRQGDQRDWCI